MTTLGQASEGSIVSIKENGTYAEFYVAKHNYESSLNGSGYTLLVRKEIHSLMRWGKSNLNCYDDCSIRQWLNDTYYNSIETEVRQRIRNAEFYYTAGRGDMTVVTRSDHVFLLSLAELGMTDKVSYSAMDGSLLPIADTLKKVLTFNGEKKPFWTRSVAGWSNYDSGYTACAVATGVSSTATSYTSVYCKVPIDSPDYGARPVFLLPNSMKIANGVFVFNTAPTISGSSYSGSNLGERSAPFNFTYTISDADNDAVTVYEYLDNVLQRNYTATLGATNTFQATYNSGQFQKILNGSHTIKVIAIDSMGNSSAAYTVSFNKQVRTATITLSSPLPADDLIKAAVINVTGSIPQDAALQVLVTNNARDTSPVWEDMTQDFKKKINHIFSNKTAANGFAFNFKVIATRGVSGTQGYISNIGGAFE